VKKVITSSETRTFYFNNAWQCVEERIGAAVDQSYVWGLCYVDDLVCRNKNSERLYVLQDANWNVVALTNTAGVVQERYTYSAFGKLNLFDAAFNVRSTSTLGITRTFTGQVLDAETGLMLYRNRVYHPTLGRFIQRDPIGYHAGDVNLMRYVGNSTAVFVDPQGELWGCLILGAAALLVVGTLIYVYTEMEKIKTKPNDKAPCPFDPPIELLTPEQVASHQATCRRIDCPPEDDPGFFETWLNETGPGSIATAPAAIIQPGVPIARVISQLNELIINLEQPPHNKNPACQEMLKNANATKDFLSSKNAT